MVTAIVILVDAVLLIGIPLTVLFFLSMVFIVVMTALEDLGVLPQPRE